MVITYVSTVPKELKVYNTQTELNNNLYNTLQMVNLFYLIKIEIGK